MGYESAADETTYCEGALLLQSSRSDANRVLRRKDNGSSFTCMHCFLEIHETHDEDSKTSNEEWHLLVSCHLQACASLGDRRAAYCCYACHEYEDIIVEISSSKMLKHIQSCRRLKKLQKDLPTPKTPSFGGPSQPQGDTWLYQPSQTSSLRRGTHKEIKTGVVGAKAEVAQPPPNTPGHKTQIEPEPLRTPKQDVKAQATATGLVSTPSPMIAPGNTFPEPLRTPKQDVKARATATGLVPTPSPKPAPRDIFPEPEEIVSHLAHQSAFAQTPQSTRSTSTLPGSYDAYGASDHWTPYPQQHASRTVVTTVVCDPTSLEAKRKPVPETATRALPGTSNPVQRNTLDEPTSPPSFAQRPAARSNLQPTALGVESSNAIDPEWQAKINELVATGAPLVDARHYLELTNGDTNRAAGLYFDSVFSGNNAGTRNADPTLFSTPLGSLTEQRPERKQRRSNR